MTSTNQPFAVPQPERGTYFEFEVVTINAEGREKSRSLKRVRSFCEDLGNGIILDMVAIPAGEFLMGTADADRDTMTQEATRNGIEQKYVETRTSQEMPQHCVKVPEFWMGKFAVTQAQWDRVAALPKIKTNLNADPSNFKGAKRPVEKISWEQAVEFCNRLSCKTGKSYRLPSEAEWEYACRAGTTTPFHFGETITTDLANYNGDYSYGNAPQGESRSQTTEVGIFPANGFGLYDMHGNVYEWCADIWNESYEWAPTDGTAQDIGSELRDPHHVQRVSQLLRGGSWLNCPWICRSAARSKLMRGGYTAVIGFRVLCSVSSTLHR